MKAIVCKEYGPPDKLSVEEIDDVVAGPGEVVIDARAVSVTFPEALIIQDKYQFKVETPFVPGGEAAGIVSSVGPGVENVSVGDAVVGGGMTGGFAERVLARADALRPLPEGMDFAAAAGLLYSYGTGYYALEHRGHLQPGETLLVLGAGGNVGIAAVELGRLMGARVIAAASSEEKLALCRERGADATIDYSKEDLKTRAKELTNGAGVDVVYDAVGGDYAEAALRATAWKGRFLVVGFTAGIPKIPLNLALLKGCEIVGVFFGSMVSREPELRDSIQNTLLGFVAEGRLAPHVSRRYSLDEGPQALQDLLDRKAVGKIVICPSGG